MTPSTNDMIIQISALREARFEPSMSPWKYLELTLVELMIATIPGMKQQRMVQITDQTRYVLGIGSLIVGAFI